MATYRGLFGTLRWLAGGVARRVLQLRRCEELVLHKDLTEEITSRVPHRLRVRDVVPEDKSMLRAFHERHGVDEYQVDRVAEYMRRGVDGFVAFEDGVLIGYVWWVDSDRPRHRTHPHVPTYDFRLSERAVYMCDFYIAPEHRGRANAVEFFERSLRTLQTRGYTEAHGLVARSKVPARWIYASFGWQTVGESAGFTLFDRIGFLNGRVFRSRPAMY